jgi:alkylation response protein AidB-like acyl-CoA dehydrogenase
MDFAWTEEEQMVLESAGTFAGRALQGEAERAHEAAGALSPAVRTTFGESGLGLLAATEMDPDLPVSWEARCGILAVLARADGAAAFSLWMEDWTAFALTALGAEARPVAFQLVRERAAVAWPFPCLPVGNVEHVLVLDSAGKWGVARIEREGIQSLGLVAAGPSRCGFVEWVEEGQADPVLADRLVAQARLWLAAILVGISAGATDYTHRYIQERQAFGQPLSQHQGVAFMAADMALRVEGAELLLHRAAWALESDPGLSASAYVEAVESALFVTNTAVQLLGGHGYMKDHPVEKWMRDARALSLIWEGVDGALENEVAGGRAG